VLNLELVLVDGWLVGWFVRCRLVAGPMMMMMMMHQGVVVAEKTAEWVQPSHRPKYLNIEIIPNGVQ